ncbi:hypothetical protein VD0002_g9032 [Verticillium dahliae]|uniref:Uncharacterized protein n=1 Tax=Verticillium dahliae TaxID=27337 RepID=A0A2J8CQG5_VERDA|nr:hypothetical protein BJF96_g8949 [Verticillium dahliae]PNH39262.1 hypothetical protein VD0004_g7622 [Verticillium dahliae]PNH49210.1 hypothetical protein VD0003_g7928 [Verticillium dahliae]PNH58499.1 hypothetical protein VD0002_g9032 [Verticillium dahliae]PNH66218.1 hypothetical protein VD0001_g8231 [Verticillium dahliae]
MTDHHIEDFPTRAVQKLTAILTLPPQHGLVRPTAGWQASQSEAVANLPQSCRRPPVEGANPIKLLKRGLMKMSEKHSLPFVPDAAVLCQAHKELHPWRMRSLFLLLASECGIRSDRIRRHHGFDGIPPAQDVQDFVYRMTSIAGLWIAPADFEARFGFRPDELRPLRSGCEACMLAVVGARAQLLVDLRANMLARSKRGYKPALLRFVDAWIEWFGDDASAVLAESQALSDQLRQIRREMGRRRRDKRRRARREGRRPGEGGGHSHSHSHSRRDDETTPEGYSLPRPPRRSDTARTALTCTGDVPPFPEARMAGARHGYESGELSTPPLSVVTSRPSEPDWFVQNRRRSLASHNVEPPTAMGEALAARAHRGRDDEHEDEDDGGDNEDDGGDDEAGPGWASQVGSYYFASDDNPGARAGWDRPGASASAHAIHPAFQGARAAASTGAVSDAAPSAASGRAPTEWTDVTVRTQRSRVSTVANLTRDGAAPRAGPADVSALRRRLEQVSLQTGAAAAPYAPSSVYSTGTGVAGEPRARSTRRRGSAAGDELAGRRNHFPPAPASRRRTVSEISEATEGTVFDMFIRHHDEVRPGDSISTVGGSGRRAGGLGGLTRGGS